MTMVFLENCYYIIVVTWTLFYLFNTFMDLPSLPWSDCSKGSKYSNHKHNNLHCMVQVVAGQMRGVGAQTVGYLSTSHHLSSMASQNRRVRQQWNSSGSEKGN